MRLPVPPLRHGWLYHSVTHLHPHVAIPATLLRTVGWTSVAAISLNTIIGAGIFTLPADIARLLGPLSPIAYLTAGTAILIVAFCFAEAGAYFSGSGGPYLYVRSAFGPFAGFQIGWMFALTRMASVAAVSHTFTDYLGRLLPIASTGLGRTISISLMIGFLAWVNYRGIRSAVRIVNILTIGKLLPLIVLGIAGAFVLNPAGFSFTTMPPIQPLQQASLLLLFALGGFEAATVPGAEVIDPKRSIPLALITSVSVAVFFYISIQVILAGTLPDLATNRTPLTASAIRVMGPAGGLLLTLGAILATSGTNSSLILAGPRMLYALAHGGQLPATLAHIHPIYRSPDHAILLFTITAWLLAISGTFLQLVALSAVTRLIYYAATCLSIPFLRRQFPSDPNRFRLKGGLAVPLTGVAICLYLFTGSKWQQVALTLAALAIGAVYFFFFSRHAPPHPDRLDTA